MLYVLLEIAILLVVAIVLGLLIGWLLWRWRRVNLAQDEYRRLLEERSALDDERQRAVLDRNEMEQQMLAARRERERSLQLVSEREQELVLVRDRERRLTADRGNSGTAAVAGAGAGAAATGVAGAAMLARTDDAPPPPPPPQSSDRTAAADDLTEIQGVGSELANFLHGQGLWTFRQVAALTDDQVDALQLHLPQFPNRIRNDDWVGQARHLHYERYGSLPEG